MQQYKTAESTFWISSVVKFFKSFGLIEALAGADAAGAEAAVPEADISSNQTENRQ